MKILHLCLAAFYIDNYSYQENMLPKYHKILGYDVEIIASLVSFDSNGKVCELPQSNKYTNEYGIPVTRLEYSHFKLSRKFKIFNGTFEAILQANPDIIFIHGCQFLDINSVIKYVRQNPSVRIYVDNHADFSNSARNFISKNILHKIIWRSCANRIEPYTTRFFGVLPARVEFLKKIYKIPEKKIRLLVMGADDERVDEARNELSKLNIRKKYNIKPEDFLITCGGKIDTSKRQTLLLMEAVKKIEIKNLKLIIFGSVIEELKNEVNNLIDGNKIQYVGWIDSNDSYKFFGASDLVVFPGRHSVLWEQVVGLGVPIIVKYWEGTTHIDLGGNCRFLYKDSVEEIRNNIEHLLVNTDEYNKMKEIAKDLQSNKFLYSTIARESIDLINK